LKPGQKIKNSLKIQKKVQLDANAKYDKQSAIDAIIAADDIQLLKGNGFQ